MRKYYLFIAVSLLLSVLVLWPIHTAGSWYPMHDTTHIARVYLMEQTIRGGQFPPIWADTINNGYGYPLFHFYAPLFYYVALIGKLVSGSYLVGLKLSLFFFISAGILGVMKLSSHWGRGAALIAGVALALSPYLALDIYVRGAFAEITALMLFPWVLVLWERLKSKSDIVLAAITTALFLISHNLIPIIAFPIIVVWVLVLHRQSLVRLLWPTLLTILISASFWLPLIFERSFVQADQIARVTDYTLHFVSPSQIWNSIWGFGGSVAGIEDGLSFKMGKIQLLLGLLGVIYLVWKKQFKRLVFPLFAVFAFFMSTILSQWLWNLLPFLAVIQFPWRYLSLAASLLAVTAGISIAFIKPKLGRYIFILIAVLTLFYFNYKYFSPQQTFYEDENHYTSEPYLSTITSIVPEFMPRWMKEAPSLPPANNLERAYYPTWRAVQDGKELEVIPDGRGVTFIPTINSTPIRLYQSHTPLERIGYALSLLGLGLSLWYWRRT